LGGNGRHPIPSPLTAKQRPPPPLGRPPGGAEEAEALRNVEALCGGGGLGADAHQPRHEVVHRGVHPVRVACDPLQHLERGEGGIAVATQR